MIEVRAVTRRFGAVTALEEATFDAPEGTVTAFVGANGAGKSTLLRILVGLDQPDTGEALVDGHSYTTLHRPASLVGVALESGLHPSRRALDHLRVYAALGEVPDERARECLDLVGLGPVPRRRGAELSAGMRTRLRLAVALLGDPPVLVLDEPTTGLDFDGVRWLRSIVADAAKRGGTVLMSSHDLATMSELADRAVFIDKGRITGVLEGAELRARTAAFEVHVSDPGRLSTVLTDAGARVEAASDGRLTVLGSSAEEIGDAAQRSGVAVYELRASQSVLEQAALALKEEGAE